MKKSTEERRKSDIEAQPIAYYCPRCGSRVIKAGTAYSKQGEQQRYNCTSKTCDLYTTKPVTVIKDQQKGEK